MENDIDAGSIHEHAVCIHVYTCIYMYIHVYTCKNAHLFTCHMKLNIK